ncbi:recombination-associated protein RdgC [Serratia sp. M24T3]|uniref:recombination-associated protein RdgC n=1 Tax=Serratia sp. M24T3 TaxID=932213 RepID=UPI00031739C6|nr:recombination-associated protein RdgC [Serratia sp. M24T3]
MNSPIFKNVIIYRLNRDITLKVEELNTQLSSFVFSPCGSQDMAKTGWVSPMGKLSDSLTHSVNGQILLCVQKEEKILPAGVIKAELALKVDKTEQEQHRKLKKTELDSLRDEVLHTLMPRAFTKQSQMLIWIDTVSGLISVATPSSRRAEDALALLRKSLGSLPVVPVTTETPIELTLTEWVRNGDTPAGFALGDSAELKAILEEGGTIRCKKQALVSDEIASHIEGGKLVTNLDLHWQERISFSLNDRLTIKRIKFADVLLEQNDDIDRDDAALRFDADFVLFTGELSKFYQNLFAALGGEIQR